MTYFTSIRRTVLPRIMNFGRIRIFEFSKMTNTNTNYIRKSSIPYMQKLLNKDNENLNKVSNQSPSYASEICHFDSITIDDLH